mgnify:CR=1 FL=1
MFHMVRGTALNHQPERHNMTYLELANELANMTPEQLNTDITVYVSGVDEYYSVVNDYPLVFSDTDDVLDANHPYFVI